jgi:hypothetical protein
MHSETAYHSLVPSQDIGEKGFLIFPFNFSVAVCNTTKGTVVVRWQKKSKMNDFHFFNQFEYHRKK